MQNHIIRQIQKTITDNSAALLTGTGVVGIVTTGVLSFRAGMKYEQVLADDTAMRMTIVDSQPRTQAESVKLMAPIILPPVSAGLTAITAVVFSYRISASQSAAVAAAYGVSEKAFQEYKDKAAEKLGVKKEEALRDEVAQDRITKNPPRKQEILNISGNVLCFDAQSGRYFRSDMESMKRAENTCNREIVNHMGASLTMFYSELELPETAHSDMVGWNSEHRCEIHVTATITESDEPCLYLDFATPPFTNYARHY